MLVYLDLSNWHSLQQITSFYYTKSSEHPEIASEDFAQSSPFVVILADEPTNVLEKCVMYGFLCSVALKTSWNYYFIGAWCWRKFASFPRPWSFLFHGKINNILFFINMRTLHFRQNVLCTLCDAKTSIGSFKFLAFWHI